MKILYYILLYLPNMIMGFIISFFANGACFYICSAIIAIAYGFLVMPPLEKFLRKRMFLL